MHSIFFRLHPAKVTCSSKIRILSERARPKEEFEARTRLFPLSVSEAVVNSLQNTSTVKRLDFYPLKGSKAPPVKGHYVSGLVSSMIVQPSQHISEKIELRYLNM